MYYDYLVNSEGGMGRLVVDPLEIRVGLILHLLRDALVPVGEQGRNVAGSNLNRKCTIKRTIFLSSLVHTFISIININNGLIQ